MAVRDHRSNRTDVLGSNKNTKHAHQSNPDRHSNTFFPPGAYATEINACVILRLWPSIQGRKKVGDDTVAFLHAL